MFVISFLDGLLGVRKLLRLRDFFLIGMCLGPWIHPWDPPPCWLSGLRPVSAFGISRVHHLPTDIFHIHYWPHTLRVKRYGVQWKEPALSVAVVIRLQRMNPVLFGMSASVV